MENDPVADEALKAVVAIETLREATADLARSIIEGAPLGLSSLQPELRAELAGRLTAALDGIMANTGRAHAAVWSTLGACEPR